MHSRNGLLFLILVLSTLIGCKKSTESRFDFDPGVVVATVNSDTIYAEAFEETYINMLSRTGYAVSYQHRFFHLNQIIDEFLLSQEAKRIDLNDSLAFNYAEKTSNRTLRNLFVKYEFLEQLELPDEKRTRFTFYRSKQNPYVRQLFFNDESQANDYYNRLNNGESFVDLANELYNTATYDSLAGFIGEIRYFGVDDVFAETVYALDAGEYSNPVRTRQGFVIVFVENWKLNPIITETEFEQRAEGIRFMLHQRDFQMGADSFIRAFMSDLNPEPVRDNIADFQSYIYQRLPQKTNPTELQRPIPSDFISSPDDLDLQAPLVTFNIRGETVAFRVQDYLNWIDSLPYDEIRNRFDASLGRALMWDTFAKESKVKGYDKDPFVEFNSDLALKFYLASRLRDSLKTREVESIEQADIADAYTAFGYDAEKLSKISFHLLEVKDFSTALDVQQEIVSGKLKMETLPDTQFLNGDQQSLRNSELLSHLLRATLNHPHIVGTRSGWFILKVQHRQMSIDNIEDVSSEIADKLSPIYNEFKLLRKLRSDSNIYIDTVAFNNLMDYSLQQDFK
ncbi:MAG TPA: hypothetical protein DCE78_07640 [Bacteroidetes bacterium]|nr:hypothetical protein [Bacteroidota bacterium]